MSDVSDPILSAMRETARETLAADAARHASDVRTRETLSDHISTDYLRRY